MVLPTSINISFDDFVDISVYVPSTMPTSTCVGGRRFCTLAASRRHHAARTVVLLDSVCSCRKRLLSLEVMGGMHVRLVLVPSPENPSHPPSRGARRRGCSLCAKCAKALPSTPSCSQPGRPSPGGPDAQPCVALLTQEFLPTIDRGYRAFCD